MKKLIRTLAIMGVGAVFLGSGSCKKTKSDQGAAILEDMMDIWMTTFEDFFDIVEDNYDICNKCLHDTDALVEQRRGQMNTLYEQWKKLSAQMSTKEKMDAIEKTRADYSEYGAKAEAMQKEHYKTFLEFDKHCSQVTPRVYKKMEEARDLYFKFMGTQY